ncbi:MAG: GNAT family N-acetyltransferase [Candidatus Delongbacteria bacterium]|nr:GNAT family N-acetyltransferase [Candidatus Delongbacteria bacterium]
MNIEYLIVKEADRDQIIALYKHAGWWTASDDEDVSFVDGIISSTFKFAIAKSDGKIIGMGRAISDGVSDAYIQDVTVDPSFRKKGIGSGIIRLLVKSLKEEKIGWIGLISEPGAENFYHELGFEVMKDHTPYIYKQDKNCD